LPEIRYPHAFFLSTKIWKPAEISLAVDDDTLTNYALASLYTA